MAPIPVDKDVKKDAIASAALRVFAHHGYGGSRMSAIASEAGIGKGTIYEYFRSKEEVFAYAIEQFMLGMSRHLSDEAEHIDDPMDQIRALIDGSVLMLQDAGGEARILFAVWAEGVRSGSDLIDLEEMYDVFRNPIRAVLEEGINKGAFRPHDTDRMASVLIGALDGLAIQWASNPTGFPLAEAGHALFDLVCAGLKRN